ncbi:MAG: type III secretion system cytoplasmic ring protein SctQ [Deltaproteobacteria bacterium]|nr:type III secretion system cytoplasmic ring protein SctQ [Deltaproteobacteria bacterium]
MPPEPAPYPLTALGRDLAGLIASVSQRFAGYIPAGGQETLTFIPIPAGPAWPPVGALDLEAGGFAWRLFLGSWELLSGRAGLEGINPADLPEDFRLAAAAFYLRPVLGDLERVLGVPLTLTGPGGPEGADSQGLEFGLSPGPDRGLTPLKIASPSAQAAKWLLDRLASRPFRRRLKLDSLTIPAVLLAGEMSLPWNLLRELAVGDILLPPAYPALENRAFLKIRGRPPIALQCGDGKARVTTNNYNAKERPLQDAGKAAEQTEQTEQTEQKDQSARPADQDQAPLIKNLDELEVTVEFELGRLSLSLKEIAALAPGTVFPLDAELTKPVTLTVSGRPVAQGRLVDLDGTVGVQVVRVADDR